MKGVFTKHQTFQLKIDNPCKQDWDSMQSGNRTRFCFECKQDVVDFSSMSDKEIINYIEQASGKLCGRLTKKQQERFLENQKQPFSFLVQKLITGLLIIGTTECSNAAEFKHTKETLVETLSYPRKQLEHKVNKEDELISDSLKNIIQGTVVDAITNEPLPSVAITIKNTKSSFSTNLSGEYKYMVPDQFLLEKIHLVFSFVGYEQLEITILKKDLPLTRKVAMNPAVLLLGEVHIIKKKKWWQFWRN